MILDLVVANICRIIGREDANGNQSINTRIGRDPIGESGMPVRIPPKLGTNFMDA